MQTQTTEVRLEALAQSDEVVSPIRPESLAGGRWWFRRSGVVWPDGLKAGLLEPRRGYRFRPENLALAALLESVTAERIIDLGTGSGSLLFIAKYFLGPASAVGVEVQSEQVDRLKRSICAHRLENVDVLEGDLRDDEAKSRVMTLLGARADLILMNPPYFPPGWGRVSQERSTQHSTHAEHGDVRDFVAAACELGTSDGTLMAVFDSDRLAHLLAAAGHHGFALTRLVWLPDRRPDKSHQPFRVWVVLRRESKGAGRIERL